MATKKPVDFDKLWKEFKEQFSELSSEVGVLLKKGEKKFVKASGKAKTNFEIMALKVKREQLLHVVGREFVKSLKKSGVARARAKSKLAKTVNEINNLEKQISADKRLLNKKK